MTPVPGSLHADAVRVLEQWAAPDAQQDALRRDYLEHLRAHPDGLDRGCLPGHLTASALVAGPEGRVLLTLHRRLGRWLQTGGHCEPGDATLAKAALREASEESGIAGLVVSDSPLRLDLHHVPCAGPGSSVAHLDVQWLATAPAGAVEVISEESIDLRWFAPDALPEGVDASVRALVGAALQLD
ncbi:8-oxo-dGTP pyrophosphatase MutT (NUDIX family) [Motilibacter peucedani]|uniref:8-oxo-dGTP pyrophosphatase MutT (NUDIX family) n=1 Tax=Motilibacter peucedani TaxID=598650 RepID=A0A420XMM4_9ACTN|nr:NUDIX hydrolase [Motilibacter peucedani]RKS72530.1 8-oxo-dGTP pyrophosphatase MutT (NUDIX family) [Motilibacter peucedani]